MSDDAFRVAVVTPYYKEPLSWLEKCHDSVLTQTHPCTHFMVADGHARSEVATWDVEHLTLSCAHADNGNTPRAIGGLSAQAQDYDAIAYLDADNWFYPDHIAQLVDLHRSSGAVVCTSGRTIHRLDGSRMFVDEENDGEKHVDTSCLLMTRAMFRLIPLWALMPRPMSPHCDRVFWQAIVARDAPRAHNPSATVAFRSHYRVHYQRLGEEPPDGSLHLPGRSDNPKVWWDAQSKETKREWLQYFATGLW